MFPGLTSVDVSDLDEFAAAMRAALDVDGPAVVSVECAADEIPPFAPFLDRNGLPKPLPNRDSNREGEPNRCRCQRLRISPPAKSTG